VRPLEFELDVDGLVRKVQVAQDGGRFDILLDGARHVVDAVAIEPGRWSLVMANGRSHEVVVVPDGHQGTTTVLVDGSAVAVAVRDPRRRRDVAGPHGSGDGPVRIVAPMPGKVVRVLASPGEAVSARQGVVVVEAMKMENELRAPRAGIVGEVLVREGDLVDAGALLLTIG
jgi:biotin carboxyl carrier protein